jgi:hypothetical protein
MKMPIYLPSEMETEVYGTGYGFICIKQKDFDGQEQRISLSVHQFSTIFNHEKTLVREALSGKEGDE